MAHCAPSRAKELPRSGKRERASGLMARPVWSQRRQARYGAKTIIQSYQYSGCSAEEASCEHVSLAGGDDCFLFTAYRRLRACLHRGRPNYWPGRSRGLFECHAGRHRARRTVDPREVSPVEHSTRTPGSHLPALPHPRMMSAAFSPIIMATALVLPLMISGMMLASATRRLATPFTFRSLSTTSPIRQVQHK